MGPIGFLKLVAV